MENKTIKIEGVETKSGVIGQGDNNGKKWVLVQIKDTEGKKYGFFTTKKDGEDTKAFAFYKENKSRWDDAFLEGNSVEVEVMYEEEEKTFTGDDGKEVNYKARNVKNFSNVDSQPTIEDSIPVDDTDVDSIPF